MVHGGYRGFAPHTFIEQRLPMNVLVIAAVLVGSARSEISTAPITAINSAAATASTAVPTLDPAAAAQTYDGHGALSAGASSRLLYDYPEPQRTEILDLLFNPLGGGAMHLLKVEIGGDGQSTDGTEPSHMHARDDLSCERGYEFWLLSEARKRNPNIVTYALSWASPAWVGNQTSYYSQDEIDYHVKWLQCVKSRGDIGNIDWIGNWNERPYGPPDWTVSFRRAMDGAGFADTKISIPDGGYSSQLHGDLTSNPDFLKAVDGIGLHYPCNRPAPEIQGELGLKFWSSEDYSTVGNWAGAACWGRLLNQNYIRMNQTSTIAWSLIWSVYAEGFSYFGNGLMYAMTPWSGHFEAGQPGSPNGGAIWTGAHTTQFTEPGWRYLTVGSGGAGMLDGGGSYVTLVSPSGGGGSGGGGGGSSSGAPHVTVVAEKLEGRCLRCAGQVTKDEIFSFKLGGALATAHRTLQVWTTNETHHFVSHGNISAAADGTFSFLLPRDSIATFSSWFRGQYKHLPSAPAPAPFPLQLTDDFDSYSVDAQAKYFADNGGSFQIARDPGGAGGGMVLKQWVTQENGVNRWGRNVPPISLLGNASWLDASVAVDVRVEKPAPAPPAPPAPLANYAFLVNAFSGLCLDTQGRGTADGARVDQYSCVRAAANEQYNWDAVSGHITGKLSQKCLTTSCGSSATKLCLASGTNCMAWDVNDKSRAGGDGTIRPRTAAAAAAMSSASATTAQCLQVASKSNDDNVFVGPCNAAGTPQQVWSNQTTPSPMPGGGDYGGVCVRAKPSDAGRGGEVCIVVDPAGTWQLMQSSVVLASGSAKLAQGGWVRLGLDVVGQTATPIVNGAPGAKVDLNVTTTASPGMVAVISSYTLAYFDNFTLSAAGVIRE